MNNGQLARHLSMLIFKMSDSGSKKMHKWFIPQGVYVRDRAVREFSYLKCFLVECMCYEASTQSGDAQMVMGLTVQKLGESWARWKNQNYGCDVHEMLSRLKEYHDCYDDIIHHEDFASVTKLFIDNVGGDYVQTAGITFNEMNSFVKDTFYKISDSIVAKTKGGGGCYIATCVYGSYDCPEVWVLRRFRDSVLGETWIGKAFIGIYYRTSPALVGKFGKTVWFRRGCKYVLDKFVDVLRNRGLSDLPYRDKRW